MDVVPTASIVPGWNGATLVAVGIVAAGLALFAAVLALTHQRERAFSASAVYLGLGAVAAPVTLLFDVDWYDPVADAAIGERLTEFAVVVALFAAGMRLDSPLWRRAWTAPGAMLLVVMPVTIARRDAGHHRRRGAVRMGGHGARRGGCDRVGRGPCAHRSGAGGRPRGRPAGRGAGGRGERGDQHGSRTQ